MSGLADLTRKITYGTIRLAMMACVKAIHISTEKNAKERVLIQDIVAGQPAERSAQYMNSAKTSF